MTTEEVLTGFDRAVKKAAALRAAHAARAARYQQQQLVKAEVKQEPEAGAPREGLRARGAPDGAPPPQAIVGQVKGGKKFFYVVSAAAAPAATPAAAAAAAPPVSHAVCPSSVSLSALSAWQSPQPCLKPYTLLHSTLQVQALEDAPGRKGYKVMRWLKESDDGLFRPSKGEWPRPRPRRWQLAACSVRSQELPAS